MAPGPINTGMLGRSAGGADGKAYLAALNPQKRVGTPFEIADAILFISSYAATFSIGQVLTVGGSRTAN